jgi:hypothetical protein
MFRLILKSKSDKAMAKSKIVMRKIVSDWEKKFLKENLPK